MEYYSSHINKLIEQFSHLPGIGAKSAQRLAFHIMNMPKEQVQQLTNAITDARMNVQYCKCCYTLTDKEMCPICSNPKRDHSTIMVVENTRDLAAYEKTGKFDGVYHVLHGAISPMLGIGPDDIKLKELIMALGNGALPLRGTEGKESRVDFLAAVTANSILDYTLEILERICIVCVGQGDIPFERIQQIIGRDPTPLAGIYLQLIRHIVSMSAVTAERFTIILTSRNQSFTGMDHSTWVLSWRWMKQARTTLMRSKRCGRLTKKMYMAMSNRMAA